MERVVEKVVPVDVHHEKEVPIERVIERVVAVPETTTKEVPVDRVIEKLVEVPQVTEREVPVEKIVERLVQVCSLGRPCPTRCPRVPDAPPKHFMSHSRPSRAVSRAHRMGRVLRGQRWV